MRIKFAFLLFMVGCGGINSATDARVVADTPRICDPNAKFSLPMPIPGLEMVNAGTAHLSPDELTIYYSDTTDLWVAHRGALTDAFDAPILLRAQNSLMSDYDPAIGPDGLKLWFASNRVMNEGFHLYVATRASTLAEFGAPGLAATVNAMDTLQSDAQPFVTADGNELWFISTRVGGLGGYDIWRATWKGDGFEMPTIVPELNSSSDDWFPTLSNDGLTIYFTSTRVAVGTKGGFDIWTSHRSSVNDGFPPPRLVDELNTTGNDRATWLSADNCRIYGTSNGGDMNRLSVATRQL